MSKIPAPTRYFRGLKPLHKFSLNYVVTLAQANIAIDTYAQRNAKEIDRTKDQPARLPKGWSKNILNGNY